LPVPQTFKYRSHNEKIFEFPSQTIFIGQKKHTRTLSSYRSILR
jgi:hypothetical protein